MARTFSRPRLGALAALTALGIAATAPLAASSVPASAKTPLQRGLAFYRGQTISFISDGAPGGEFDTIARDLAPYFSSYLHATVNVEDISSGATIPGQNFAEAAAPNGLTIGEINAVGDAANVLTHTLGINFNPARVAYIASYGPSPLVLLATPASGITSFAQVKNATTPYRALTQATGTGPTITRSIMGVLHAPVNWLTGYANAGQQVAGFQRGDGQLAWVTLGVGGPLIQGGAAKVIAATSKAPKGMAYGRLIANVPTTADLLKQYPAKNRSERAAYAAVALIDQMAAVLPIFTQTGVDATRVDALRAAAKWAFQQSSLRTELLNQGQNDQYADPVAAKQVYIDTLKDGAVLVPYFSAT
ncbi:MAG TPA: hypothetical protein VNF07_01860 [Acidimicrobiales bacterium]|nr:hypothetical protein [Acidimicrobiales bacterium]